jgi:drug/metabolite transporter (DMT)-like permease
VRLSKCAIVLCTFIGASTIVVAEPLLKTVPPILLLATRFTLAAILLAVAAPKRVFPLTRNEVHAGFFAGIGFGVGSALLYLALPHVRAGKVTFLVALEVIIVPVVSALLYKQRLTRFELGALVLAVLGLWLIAGDAEGALSWWDIVGLLSAFAYALYTISLSRLAISGSIVGSTFVSFCIISVLSLATSYLSESFESARWSASGIKTLLYLATIGSVARFLIQAWAQKTVSASFTALTFTAEPVFAIGLSYIFLGERFSATQTCGAVVIIAALLIANAPRSKKVAATTSYFSPSPQERSNIS